MQDLLVHYAVNPHFWVDLGCLGFLCTLTVLALRNVKRQTKARPKRGTLGGEPTVAYSKRARK